MTIPSYDYYNRALQGDFSDPPAIDDPQPGFWRHHYGDPIAIYSVLEDDGSFTLHCVRGGMKQTHEQMLANWPYCSAHPVSEEVWKTAVSDGQWPDEAPGIGHNRPRPESAEDRITKATELAREWLETYPEISTTAQADHAGAYATELTRALADLHLEEERHVGPWLALVGEIRAKFARLAAPAKNLQALLKERLRIYKLEQERVRAEERRRQAEEDAARRAEGRRKPYRPPDDTRIGGGTVVQVRTYWRAKIEDYPAALAACSDSHEVRYAVEKVAERRARTSKGKDPLPGTTIIEERR